MSRITDFIGQDWVGNLGTWLAIPLTVLLTNMKKEHWTQARAIGLGIISVLVYGSALYFLVSPLWSSSPLTKWEIVRLLVLFGVASGFISSRYAAKYSGRAWREAFKATTLAQDTAAYLITLNKGLHQWADDRLTTIAHLPKLRDGQNVYEAEQQVLQRILHFTEAQNWYLTRIRTGHSPFKDSEKAMSLKDSLVEVVYTPSVFEFAKEFKDFHSMPDTESPPTSGR